tara:strand:+ start:715 stop:1659 length:945 start_codon:yes stop_codon:yes gene_type:complete
MSKLNVNELEANGTNSNLKVVSKGTTGVCEVKGATNDGTLQLNCSAQSHGVKLKAPADSAGQNYKITLPDNQIAANKLLKIKSLTGSGTTAEGQLEFVDTPPAAYTNLDASNINSGVFPTERLGNFAATGGAGLELVTKTTVTGTDAPTSISFTGLEDNAHYLIIGKHVKFASGFQYLLTTFLGSDGTVIKDPNSPTQAAQVSWLVRKTMYNYNNYAYWSTNPIYIESHDTSKVSHYMRMELFTAADYVHLFVYGHYLDKSANVNNENTPMHYICRAQLSGAGASRVHGIKFENYSSNTFVAPTDLTLYKYVDA